uniref:Calmodulin-like protein 5 n=1 Tax=Triatoma infestans TaxID=30076 RepID=A0A161M7P8_TRIIF
MRKFQRCFNTGCDLIMFFTKVLLAKSAADRIRDQILRGSAPRLRRPTVFNEKENEYHERLFKHFDKNGDYYLDRKELNRLVNFQTNDELHDCDINKPFKKMDINSDNKVSIQEYLHHVSKSRKKLPLKREVEEIFNMYDTNYDGHINLDELRQILLYMGEDFTRTDLRYLFVSVDNDKDGLIDYYQFEDLIFNQLRAPR